MAEYKLKEIYLDADRLPYVGEVNICYQSDGCVKTALDVYNIAKSFNADKYSEEHAYGVALDAKLHILGMFEISHGVINNTVMSSREIYQKALLLGASGLVVFHNHPSGVLDPSESDRVCYERLKKVEELIDIPLLDFVIITQEGYLSIRDLS